MTITATIAATIEPIQMGRSVTGRLLAFGRAAFKHVRSNPASVYLQLETDSGVVVVWGPGLLAALLQASAQVHDFVNLTYEGRKPIMTHEAVRDHWRVERVDAPCAACPRLVGQAHAAPLVPPSNERQRRPPGVSRS